jgi:hypothetical protein
VHQNLTENVGGLQAAAFAFVTAKQAVELPPGPELDLYCHSEILRSCDHFVPRYSIDLVAAALIANVLAARGWKLQVVTTLDPSGQAVHTASFGSEDWPVNDLTFRAERNSAAEAIVRAAIHANSVVEIPNGDFSDSDEVHLRTCDPELERDHVWLIDSPQFALLGELCFVVRNRDDELASRIVPTAELRHVSAVSREGAGRHDFI